MSKQAEGGKARAEKLTPGERSAIAKKGAEARWADGQPAIPRETHTGELKIGELILPCSVLADGTRVLSRSAVQRAMGSSYGGRKAGDSGAAELPRFLARKSIMPFLSSDLTDLLTRPVMYRPMHGGRPAMGYEATVLPKICSAILDARDAKALQANQAALAIQSDMLVRAFAQVGIVALVDEATGYQADRDKDELQKLLAVYLTEERRKWISTFPSEFFTQIYRLHGWKKPLDNNKRTPQVGKIINQIVYDQLPEGILEELRKRNPTDFITKRRKFKHHQFLSEDVGHPDLRAHLQQLLVLMRISDDWPQFKNHFIRAFIPNAGVQQSLNFDDE